MLTCPCRISHYRDWFAYFDAIDVRRHLQEVEIVLIEAALEKSNGMISHAADALKLRRTTLIEKMKKFMIEKPINQLRYARCALSDRLVCQVDMTHIFLHCLD